MNDYLHRQRIGGLLQKAVRHPLSVVCAGAGCGKTSAVADFTAHIKSRCVWMQFSERDNAASRFWGKYIQIVNGWNAKLEDHCRTLGFPDTADKISRHLTIRKRLTPAHPRLIVLDDVHLITNPDILNFIERGLHEPLKNTSVILVCRELPRMDMNCLYLQGRIPTITEEDLKFTEGELAELLSMHKVTFSNKTLRSIMDDTGGWAFSINLIANSLNKSPGYNGFVQVAVRRNIFKLMELETYNSVSERLRRFLIRLSLIEHIPAELLEKLADRDAALLAELRNHHAYIRFDRYTNAYLIHDLYLDFLRERQSALTAEEIEATYRAAAEWCVENGYEYDALVYYGRVADYEGIVSVLSELPVTMPSDLARLAFNILERAPRDAAGTVFFYAVFHVRLAVRLGLWTRAFALLESYESEFLRREPGDAFRNRTLGALYYSWANMRALMCTTDDRFDFDLYYAKAAECLQKAPTEPDRYSDMPIGFWASLVGSREAGAPQAYIEAADRAVTHTVRCWEGTAIGINDLCRGELMFYQGNTREAERLCLIALKQAKGSRQYEIEHKALFYLMRIALWQGNGVKAEEYLNAMDKRLFTHYETALAWYCCTLRKPEQIPLSLKEGFTPYSHAYLIDNTGNQIKARYCYLRGDYPPLLAYIEELKRRESVLYGRVEMLALEACVHLQMKDKPLAFASLRAAYDEAWPNEITAPFIELGRDMRTLAAAALRTDGGAGIPPAWLEMIMRKASSYAKNQSAMLAYNEKAAGLRSGVKLSAREHAVLTDLYHGLSRNEIAAKQALSVNTVNSAVNSIFNKLGAHNVVDAVRIANEEGLL